MVLYIRQNRICFGVSLLSISKHTRDFSLNYFDEFKFFSLKRLKIDDIFMIKAKIALAATLQNKICSQNFTQKYYKIYLFCKKKQDFSAARTPHSKVEVNLFWRVGWWYRTWELPWLKCSSSKLFVWHLSRRIVRMESVEKWAAIYRKKPSRDWLEKDQWESVISVQSLSCIRILFVGRGRG